MLFGSHLGVAAVVEEELVEFPLRLSPLRSIWSPRRSLGIQLGASHVRVTVVAPGAQQLPNLIGNFLIIAIILLLSQFFELFIRENGIGPLILYLIV